MLPPRDAVERIALGTPRAFDAGRIAAGATRYFANGMDIGFGAHASRNVRKVPAFLTGLRAYLGALALTLARYPGSRCGCNWTAASNSRRPRP